MFTHGNAVITIIGSAEMDAGILCKLIHQSKAGDWKASYRGQDCILPEGSFRRASPEEVGRDICNRLKTPRSPDRTSLAWEIVRRASEPTPD